jgi:hypothetical protein
MTTIEDQISKVERKIEEVETKIVAVERKLEGELSQDDKAYFREEKKQLREEKNQLHVKENLLLNRQQPQPNGELRCCLCILVFQCCFEYENDSVCSPSAVFLFLLLPKPLRPTLLVFY